MDGSVIFGVCRVIFLLALFTALLVGIYAAHDKLKIKYGVKVGGGKKLGYTYKLSYSYIALTMLVLIYIYSVVWSAINSKYVYNIAYLYGIPIIALLNSVCGFKRTRLVVNTIVYSVLVVLSFILISYIL